MDEIKAYKRFCEILNNLNPYAIKLGLERVEQFCKKLGNPQDEFKSILVGGTNGKGSVCQFLTDCLVDGGYNCGTYTSPHLILPNERFKINNRSVDFSTLLEYAEFLNRINFEGLTYFEFLTVLAFLLFKDFGVDVGVLEVGMGGEYDATNVVNPILSVLTSISFDHEEHLGKSLREIALTKSKIIKNIGVIGKNPPEVTEVIINNTSCELVIVDDVYFERAEKLRTFNAVNKNNIAVALASIDVLNEMYGFKLSGTSLSNSFLAGRFEVIKNGHKTVVIDGAHNESGILNLKGLLEDSFKDLNSKLLIFSSLNTKKWHKYLYHFAKQFDAVWTTRVNYRLSEDPIKIANYLESHKFDGEIKIFEDVNACLNEALVSNFDLTVITGSLYLVGEVLACSIV